MGSDDQVGSVQIELNYRTRTPARIAYWCGKKTHTSEMFPCTYWSMTDGGTARKLMWLEQSVRSGREVTQDISQSGES